MSWWWGAGTLTLVLAAALMAVAARRVEIERAALSTALDGLRPLGNEVAELRSQLVRTAAGAAARRDRLTAVSSRRPSGPEEGPPGPRRGRTDGHR